MLAMINESLFKIPTILPTLLFEVRGSLRPVWMRQLVGAEPRGPISCHGNGSSP